MVLLKYGKSLRPSELCGEESREVHFLVNNLYVCGWRGC